ncbi:2091_t:CDS:2 [Scutellospora calospora]|uniref:2091_t:CDS:1 n=1 Tax=Scutellospora calospora TaxID=85575 RepID=A0ACA9K3U2_9GLOM|nr:2091_t:CDS:2 [Scutellospora calospora]
MNDGYINNNNEMLKYVPDEEIDKILEMLKVEKYHSLSKDGEQISSDDEVNRELSKVSQLVDNIDKEYILNNKQSCCFDLTRKFEGYTFVKDYIEKASKKAFTIDVDKVELKTQINNVIENIEKCNRMFDILCKRNFISYENISSILPWLSIFYGKEQNTSGQMLEHLTNTTEFSYKKWEKSELIISKQSIRPTNSFITDVKNALKGTDNKSKVTKLREVTKKYGNFYARRLVFGGAIIRENTNIETVETLANIINSNQNSKVRIIGGIKKEYNNDSIKSWVNSLDNYTTWDIIEYDEIYSIFDLLDDNLQKEILDALGHRILKADVKDIPLNWDFSKKSTYVHSLTTHFAELDKITNIYNCHIFASFINKKDRDFFSLRIDYMNKNIPLIIVHPKRPLHKKCKKYPIKIGWVIVGQLNNFDFDQTKYPVVLKKSSEYSILKVDKHYKIEFPKCDRYLDFLDSCALNTCVFGLLKVNSSELHLTSNNLTSFSVYDLKDIKKILE